MRGSMPVICSAILWTGLVPCAWPQTTLPQAPATPPVSLRELSASFEHLVNRVRPAVVQVFSTGYAAVEEGEGTSAASVVSKQRSTGTGVILSADGYIVTNNHVVQGGRRIQVRLPVRPDPATHAADQMVDAKLIGVDRDTDLAVLKIEAAGLPYLLFGNSNTLRQGQIVMAFGNPLGLEGSVTMGVVSATARQLRPDDPMAYVQTDAPINPGNSGGPLVDADGRVVGINTFILSQSGGSEGLGFAIPSNVVRNSYQEIKKAGHVHRGQIGIYAQTITPLMADGLKLPRKWGAVIADVVPEGPADHVGLKIGDIILALDGRAIENAGQLEVDIYRHSLDTSVKLDVLRDTQKLSFVVPVIEREDDPQRFADMVDPDKNLIARLGILGIEITEKLAEMLPDLRHEFGVVVAAKVAGGPEAASKLQTGDVIYSVNGTPAVTVRALRDALANLKSGDVAVLQIERDSRLRFVTLELE